MGWSSCGPGCLGNNTVCNVRAVVEKLLTHSHAGKHQTAKLSTSPSGAIQHLTYPLSRAGAVLVLMRGARPWRGTVRTVENALGYNWGARVFVFFGLSGFFIAGSLMYGRHLAFFFFARASRLFAGGWLYDPVRCVNHIAAGQQRLDLAATFPPGNGGGSLSKIS